MSNVDFDNGFLCGLAVKGNIGGDSNKLNKCPNIITFDFKLLDIGFKIVDYTPPQTINKEE